MIKKYFRLVLFKEIVYNVMLKRKIGPLVKGVMFLEGRIRDGFKEDGKVKIFTIPNVLSMFRICLIPLFVYLFINK